MNRDYSITASIQLLNFRQLYTVYMLLVTMKIVVEKRQLKW